MNDDASLQKYVIELAAGNFPFYCRRDSPADQGVVQQIFGQHDYRIDQWAQGRLVRDLYDSVCTTGVKPLILDAGANIGASAAYFTHLYPDAQVIAVEPEPNNAALLRMNCPQQNVHAVEGAIGAVDGTLFLVDPALGDWGFRVETAGDRPVPVYAVETLLNRFDRKTVFPLICKIDIEGGEAHLFETNTGWMDCFPLIIIELHDWMLPFKGSSRGFMQAIGARDFELTVRGENLFCFNASFFDR
jgi:FkbM family methyltransferase